MMKVSDRHYGTYSINRIYLNDRFTELESTMDSPTELVIYK